MKINIDHYNRMLDALKTIATSYQTPDQLRRNCNGQYGLGYEETLEMAYDNIQQLAKEASKGVRRIQKGKTAAQSLLQSNIDIQNDKKEEV